MKSISLKRLKLKVHPTFFCALLFFLLMGYLAEFGIILFSVTLHEYTHVLTAKRFKLQLSEVVIMPIGECARIENINQLSPCQKYLLYLSGPLINLLLGFILYCIQPSSSGWQFFMEANLFIGLFNLIPVYPLDGGKIFYTVVGNLMGILKANALFYLLSTGFGIFLVAAGFLQLILYPVNMSLLLIGLYFLYINRNMNLSHVLTFYQDMDKKYKLMERDKTLPIRQIILPKGATLQEAVKMLSWDYFHLFYVAEKSKSIDEKSLMAHVMSQGLHGTVSDAL